MDLRTRITTAMKQAMRDKDQVSLSTVRLINAAIKDRDIAERVENPEGKVSDSEVQKILAKMVKQRRESVKAYEEAGRLELAAQEEAEIAVIEEFLPRQLKDEEVGKAIAAAIADAQAASIRDMGKVMGLLKQRHGGQMDFGAVGPMVKDHLSAG
ncbi:MAG: GatB/YqeY domain-containing protein [Oceanicola sp.]|nr:GatB/YqeY domain-containing protein [Oceanicola sp.]